MGRRTIFILSFCLTGFLACSSSHDPAAVEDGGGPPRYRHVGVANAHEMASFYSATTGVNPASESSVVNTFTGLRQALPDGHTASLPNVQASLDLALSVCRAARGRDEARPLGSRRLFAQVNFGQSITAALSASVRDAMTDTIFLAFTGEPPSSLERSAAAQTLNELVAASGNDLRLALESYCAVIAVSALSSLGKK